MSAAVDRARGGIYEAFRRVNKTKRVEDSVALRALVLATVMVAVTATLIGGAAAPASALFALLLLPVGAWVSHDRRGKDNTLIKLALTLGAGLSLVQFFGQLRGSVSLDDTREPLANLFLAVQVLHGFDLPARRDLGFTLASSLTLVALAGVASHDTSFAIALAPYVVLTAVSSALLQRSAAREYADERTAKLALRPLTPAARPRAQRAGLRTPAPLRAAATAGAGLLRASGPALLVGLLVFLLLPRTQSLRLGTLPFRGLPGLPLSSPDVFNPGLEDGGRDGDGSVSFDAAAYFGFAEHVDVRTVGRLSDAPVMRVRADMPRFWRGMVFDEYEDGAWSRSSELPNPLYGVPVRLHPEVGLASDTTEVIQTYELVADTPNLIFAASDASEVYISAGSVHKWDDGTITTAGVQDTGTVYSVVSTVDVTPPEVLADATGAVPAEILARYTQVPDTLPQRVRDLGRRLTADAATTYDKAKAVEDWIASNVEYSINLQPFPEDVDPIDHFLFDRKVGWCEPIAASMVLMLRANGVPARLATGFAPGDHNTFTGWFEVQMSDAHAWAEVWIPDHGWTAFDPTGRVPQALDGTSVPRIALFDALKTVGGWIAAIVPAPVERVFVAGFKAVRERPALLLAPIVVVALGLLLKLVTRRRRLIRTAPPPDPFGQLAHLLERHGVPRDRWQTPREYVQRVVLRRPRLPQDALRRLLDWEETRRYVPGAPTPPREIAEAALREVVSSLDEHERDRELVTAGQR